MSKTLSLAAGTTAFGALPTTGSMSNLNLAGATVSGSLALSTNLKVNYFDATLPGSSVPPGMGNSAPHSPNNVPVVDGTTTFGYLSQKEVLEVNGGGKAHVLITADLTTSGLLTLTMSFDRPGTYVFDPNILEDFEVNLTCSAFRAANGNLQILEDSFTPGLGVACVPLLAPDSDTLSFDVPYYTTPSAPTEVSGPFVYRVQLLAGP